MFCEKEIPKRLNEMNAAMETGSKDKLIRSAHSFKGSANNMGAQKLADLCSELESSADQITEDQTLELISSSKMRARQRNSLSSSFWHLSSSSELS
jgi:HPt (histidine-containing phosphotransfer) domain-containing protein